MSDVQEMPRVSISQLIDCAEKFVMTHENSRGVRERWLAMLVKSYMIPKMRMVQRGFNFDEVEHKDIREFRVAEIEREIDGIEANMQKLSRELALVKSEEWRP